MLRVMRVLANLLVVIVAVLHMGFAALEMLFWDHEIGRSVFNMTAEQSAMSAQLAFNQGLYNLFLAAGLLWGLLAQKRDVVIFFLLCVITAGIVGALTVKMSIFFTQGVPAIAALLAWLLSARGIRKSRIKM
jgi:putative membrane protein